MNTRQVILASVLSSLLTLVIIVSVMFSVNVVAAQGRQPQPTPTTLPETPGQPLPEAIFDPNESAGSGTAVLEEANTANAAAASAYQHVTGMALYPLNGTTTKNYSDIGCVYLTGTGLYLTFPIIVPDGSRITQLRVYYRDSSVGTNGILSLVQYDDGVDYTSLHTVSTTGSTGTSTFSSVDIDLMPDYVNYSYSLVWAPGVSGDTMQLCGYRIAYTPPSIFGTALPVIRR